MKLKPLYREVLNEYLASFDELSAKIDRLDQRMEELAAQSRYQEIVKRLGCFLGIKTHTALSLIVETGDFARFSKAGNTHLRTLLIESACGICKCVVGYKSKAPRKRQNGNTAEVIAYADKANTRLRSNYYRFIRHGKKKNVAGAAIARELACFMWGMMTDHIAMQFDR